MNKENEEFTEESELIEMLGNPTKDVFGNPGDANFTHAHELIEVVKETIDEFQISHPTITKTVNNIIHSFNASGI